ncbi:MAG: GIY-YIG nuclease family protein [Acidimicrobiales bacterium]
MPDALGISIRLFLADGTPDGLWVVEKSNWTGVALMAPRSRYSALRSRPELAGSGVYVLTGPPEGGAKSVRIYVGETDVLRDRLDNHQKNKDFWTKVVIFTAKDLNLNKAHVRYLESRLLSIAAEANRAELDNGTATTLPALSEADRADLESFLADMLLIYPVLGLNAFEKVDEASQTTPGERLYLKGKDTKAEGQETSDGFVVFKDALARQDEVPSIHAYGRDLRQSLTEAGVLVADGEHLRLTQDYVFGSPSLAAMILLGRTSNGRIEWRTAAGVTLKDLQEQAIEQG